MATDPIKAQLVEQRAIDTTIRPVAPSNANRDERIAALETEVADHESRIDSLENP